MEKQVQNFVIYSRKSKFTGKGESIENQVELCRQYIASHYGNEAAEHALVYEDEGYSGKNLERPQFKKMMKDAKQRRVDAIVVYRLDRISRNVGDFATLTDELNMQKIEFISIREQFDTTTPMGRAMMYIASVFSQLERETIAERIRDNMHELAKTGRWLGGTTPTGYASESVVNVTIDGKPRKACMLKIIPDEIRLVKTIYEKFLEFGSLTKVDQYLLERRIQTKRGKEFTRFAIRGILSNPVYMIADEAAHDYLMENDVDLYAEKSEFDGIHGIMAYNRTLQQQGKSQKLKPMNEWIVAVGKHEGVIDGQTWVKVQKMLEGNRSKMDRQTRSNVALVSGLLRCKACGDYMRPKRSQRTNAKGEYIYSYLCETKERSRCYLCNMKNVNGNLLDAMVIDEIKKLGEGWEHSEYAKYLQEAKKAICAQQDECEAEMASLWERIAEKDTAIKNLVATLSKVSGSVSEPYIIEQIGELHRDRDALMARMSELEALNAKNELTDLEFDLIRQTLSSFSATIDDMNVLQKRQAIRALVKRIEWDGENVHLYLLHSEGDCDLPDIEDRSREDSAEPLCEDSE